MEEVKCGEGGWGLSVPTVPPTTETFPINYSRSAEAFLENDKA